LSHILRVIRTRVIGDPKLRAKERRANFSDLS
jgi:hypothetical protein